MIISEDIKNSLRINHTLDNRMIDMLIDNVNQLNDRINIIFKQVGDGPDTGEDKILLFSCWTYEKKRTLKGIKDSTGTLYEDTINFVIRYDQVEEVTNKMIVSWKNKSSDIINVNPDSGDKKFTIIVAK